jgi:SAM-dependent methyltransferase
MFPQLYHAHHNRHLEDLPFWRELASQAGDPVLELGCGTGRVLIPLAVAGHRTIGLDHDPSMLKFLRGNLDARTRTPPLVFVADLSKFHLARQFPLILLPCNTFSTLGENQRKACLKCAGRHLKPGGIFAVSIPNPEILLRLPATAEAEIEDEFFHPQTGNPVQVSSSWQRTKQSFILTWIYDHLIPDGTVEHMVVESVHQLTHLETTLGEFQNAGLNVSEIYGDFDRSGYGTESPHLILLAKNDRY